jgi:hypothetical protein
MRKKIIAFAVLALVLLPTLALAQSLVPAAEPGQAPGFLGGNTTIGSILRAITRFLLGFAGVVAILFIIYGGFRYITAGGNEDAAESGKHILTNAIIGFAIILLSWVILIVIENVIYNRIA